MIKTIINTNYAILIICDSLPLFCNPNSDSKVREMKPKTLARGLKARYTKHQSNKQRSSEDVGRISRASNQQKGLVSDD